MSASSPAITNALVQLTATLQTINSVANPQTVSCIPSISGVTYINELQGTYTPANDTKTLFSPSGASQSPNLMLLIVDQPIGLTIVSNAANVFAQVPVSKVHFATWATLTNPITSFVLDGTIAGARSSGVQQAILLNWYLLVAVCTIA